MIYFLEHKTEKKWLTDKEHGYVLTDDPIKAMWFDKIEIAKLYLAVNQKDGTLEDFIVTEHEFVPPAKCEQAHVSGQVCDHDWVYKILFDHTAADVCTKCGKIKKQTCR